MIIIDSAACRYNTALSAIFCTGNLRPLTVCGQCFNIILVEGETLNDILVISGIRGLQQLLDVDREFDRISGRPGSQVVLAGLESLLPGVEVHRGHLGEVGLGHVDVEALRLANVGATSHS